MNVKALLSNIKPIPVAYSKGWYTPRKARIKFRQNDEFVVQDCFLSSDGDIIHVRCPQPADELKHMGHSLYQGDVCWYTIDPLPNQACYFSEFDLEFLEDIPE